MLTYFVFIFFFSIVLYGVIQKKWMAGVFIIGIYALSSFCSILVSNIDTYYKPTILPTILYCGFLFITLKPFIRKKPVIEGFRYASEQKRFVFVGYTLSLVVIFGMILILPKITNALSFGLVDVRTAMYRGEEIYTTKESLPVKLGSIIVGYFGGIWFLYIMMFFYALAFLRGKILLKIFLIIASLAQVELGLAVGGRTNAMYWLLSFLFSLILFYPYLNKNTRIIAISSSFFLFFIVAAYVTYITIQRSIFRDGGTQGFLLEYMGQSYLNFSEFFDKVDWHPYTLERIFPFTSNVLGTGFNLQDYRDLLENRTGMFIGIFYTFMGDIFMDIGTVGLLLFVFLYNRTSTMLLKPKVFHFREIIYLSIICAIPLHGVFYYSLWKNGDFFVLLLFVISKYITMGGKTRKASTVINNYNQHLNCYA